MTKIDLKHPCHVVSLGKWLVASHGEIPLGRWFDGGNIIVIGGTIPECPLGKKRNFDDGFWCYKEVATHAPVDESRLYNTVPKWRSLSFFFFSPGKCPLCSAVLERKQHLRMALTCMVVTAESPSR